MPSAHINLQLKGINILKKKKILWIIIALILLVISEWPKIMSWKLENDFSSDELIDAGRCVVAIEMYHTGNVSLNAKQEKIILDWKKEANIIYSNALDKALKKLGDHTTFGLSDKATTPQIAIRYSKLSAYAINKAREEAGWGTGETNTSLLKEWVSSSLCKSAYEKSQQQKDIQDKQTTNTQSDSDPATTAQQGIPQANSNPSTCDVELNIDEAQKQWDLLRTSPQKYNQECINNYVDVATSKGGTHREKATLDAKTICATTINEERECMSKPNASPQKCFCSFQD